MQAGDPYIVKICQGESNHGWVLQFKDVSVRRALVGIVGQVNLKFGEDFYLINLNSRELEKAVDGLVKILNSKSRSFGFRYELVRIR